MDHEHDRDAPDRDHWADWYATHWEPTRRLATRLTGDATEAEDIAANVLTRVWSRWEVVGVPEAPEAYLARAVRNEVASHFRRRGRERNAVDRLETTPDDRSAEVIALEREGVRLLLTALPTADRRTFALRGLEDLPFDEIARELRLRPVSVRSRVHRTRRRMAPVPG